MGRKTKDTPEESVSEADNIEQLNGEQIELENMPPSSPVGKAARTYIRIHNEMKDSVAKLKDRKGTAQEALIAEMEKIKKDSICVDGYSLSRRHVDEDKISVKAPKVE